MAAPRIFRLHNRDPRLFGLCRAAWLQGEAAADAAQRVSEKGRELSEPEYRRLLGAAQSSANERLHLVMLAICSTGIRVSELKCITLEAVRAGPRG